MTDDRHEREVARAALNEAHRPTRRRAPEFALLWSRAADQQGSRRRARKIRFAVAAVCAVLILAVTIGLRTANRQGRRELERAMVMATTLEQWQAPLDFLLETPGQEWLETKPHWDLAPAAEPWSITPDHLEEVFQ